MHSRLKNARISVHIHAKKIPSKFEGIHYVITNAAYSASSLKVIGCFL